MNTAETLNKIKEDEGVIFNIQKFSIHDGPGIRTVVFSKGCPLKCPWCSNPESQKVYREISWKTNTCIRCYHCQKTCPVECIEFKDKNFTINQEKCIECDKCIKECPTHSLSFEGEYMTVDEVYEKVIKDKPFYDQSGGGVTFSGGETLLQDKFLLKMLKKFKENHVHTCLETTLYTSEEIFEEVIPYVDLILCDLKHYDDEKHKKYIGASFEPIHRNIKRALEKDVDLVGRIPIIPDFNDSLEDAKMFCKLIKELGIKEVNLLPFHQFGENKYDLLGRDYKYKDVKQYNKKDQKILDYYQIFLDEGINCKL